jgi:hypothetical protein
MERNPDAFIPVFLGGKQTIPEFSYCLILIDKDGQLVQHPYYAVGKGVYSKMVNHIVLGALKIETISKNIVSIEQAPPINSLSRYIPLISLTESQKIWRYIELYKFEDLLKTSSLYFTRIDCFKDNLEGISSESCKTAIANTPNIKETKIHEQFQLFDLRMQRNRESTFVCCWHINDEINPSMREAYGDNNTESIIVETSVAQLDEISQESPVPILFESIRYFDEPFFNQESYWFPTLFKRREDFEHEREYRSSVYISGMGSQDFIRIKVNLNTLITNVYINPQSSGIHKKRIKELMLNASVDLDKLKEK